MKLNQNRILRFGRQDVFLVSMLSRKKPRIRPRWGGGLAMLLVMALSPGHADACACGCGVFDVATSSMFPMDAGGMIYLDSTFQNQNRNWSGTSSSPAALNDDKQIRTESVTAGFQYLFGRSWGIQMEVPYVDRGFKCLGGASGSDLVSLHWSGLGDMRVKGMFTGFSDDLSSGITFGLKLPTGSDSHNDAFGDIDRDTQIGSGSTDLLLGAFYRHKLTADGLWSWFAQAELDLPLFVDDHYRPGTEVDAAVGVYYEGWTIGRVQIKPVAQVIGSIRGSDSGMNSASPVASGYERLLISSGLEFRLDPVSIYLDAEVPVYEHVTGQQLVSRALFKLVTGYRF